MTDKEIILKAWDVAERHLQEGKDHWPHIYIEWFNSALHKMEEGKPVPAFTLTAAKSLLLDEKETTNDTNG